MALPTTAAAARTHAARALIAIGMTALVAACGTADPNVRVAEPDLGAATASDRFSADGLDLGYTAVVPRAFIGDGELDDNAPDSYTVVRGDTLWDISDRFLKEPWRWQEIWGYNPQIANPHLIYPGDKLALEYVDGKPTLVLTRNGKVISPGPATGPNGEPILGAAIGQNVTRLSPRIRSESLDDAVPTISGDSIRQFLVKQRVVDLETIRNAPYVMANDDKRLASSIGQQIYVRGAIKRDQTRYGVYRRNKVLEDPITGAVLGYEIVHVADAKLLNIGDPSTLSITNNKMETINGDILLPLGGHATAHEYVPRLPRLEGDGGRIISLVNAISQTGRDQVVVLNIGTDGNLAIGDILAIEARGGTVVDRRGRGAEERVTLPNMRTGVVMVFETFDKVSYALVMESTRPVSINDVITGI